VRIDICVNTVKSLRFARETVHDHLRLVIGVDLETGRLKAASPSEPVVAEVAATLLVRNDGTKSEMETWMACIHTLPEQLFGDGIIDKGIKGELFGHLLRILAEDFRYSRPFGVSVFLNELLDDKSLTISPTGRYNVDLMREPCRTRCQSGMRCLTFIRDSATSTISHTHPQDYLRSERRFRMSSQSCSRETRRCSWLLAKAIGMYFCLFIPETSTNPLREIICPRFQFDQESTQS